MNAKMSNVMTMIAVCGLGMAFAKPASAVAVETSPYAGAVIAVAGMTGGDAKLVWYEKSTSNCTTVDIGTSIGLDDNHVIVGTSATTGVNGYYADELVISTSVSPNFIRLPCNSGNIDLTSLLPNSYTIDLSGAEGPDFLSGSDFTNVTGGEGDDWIVTFKSTAVIESDEDNANDGEDAVLTLGSAGSEEVWTYGQTDCVYDTTKTYTSMNCGSGTNLRRTGMSGTTNCSVSVTNCTGLH